MKRDNGHYWIKSKHGGHTTIGLWSNTLNIWVIVGCDECHLDNEFEVIGNKIENLVESKSIEELSVEITFKLNIDTWGTYVKGDTMVVTIKVFDENVGIIRYPIDKHWDIVLIKRIC